MDDAARLSRDLSRKDYLFYHEITNQIHKPVSEEEYDELNVKLYDHIYTIYIGNIMNNKEIRQKYTEILNILESNEEFLKFDSTIDSRSYIKSMLSCLDSYEIFGIDFEIKYGSSFNNGNWLPLLNYCHIMKFNPEHNKIHNSKEQPGHEWLYQISFPTGAYIFNLDEYFSDIFNLDKYFPDIFNDFWEELKTYKYKFIDNMNRCIYFSPDNARAIHDNLELIIEKYRKLATIKFREVQIKRAEDKLAELKKIQ